MSSAVSSASDAAPPSAFAAAPGAFPAFATQAPASAATAAAMAASPSAASHPPSTAGFGAFAGQSFPAGPAQSSPFGPRAPSAPPSAFAFAAPAGSDLSSPFACIGPTSFASAAEPAPFANNAFGSAAVPSLQPPAAQSHFSPTAQLIMQTDSVTFADQLTPHLQTREGVFALSWHEASTARPRATLLMRYCAVGEHRWRASLTPRVLDAAHGWIAEKLAAELADGHGYDHEVRNTLDRSALDLLLGGWMNRPELVLSMAPVLLSAPSVALRLRGGGDRRETTRLVETIVLDLASFPVRLEPVLVLIALIVERGGSFDQALQTIVKQSHVHALLRVIKAATVEQLQSLTPATLALARKLEQQRPYKSPQRLCRELIERVCEGQAAEAVVGSSSTLALASLACVPSSLAGSSLAAWLSAFESALPARLFAHQSVARGCSEAEWLAALAQFDWPDLAEEGLMRTFLSMETLWCATVERVQQLAARERVRAADDEVRPASGPLSPPAIIAHLIREAMSMAEIRHDPTSALLRALLRALLSAATAPAFASLSPSSPSGGLAIPGAFDVISWFPENDLMRVALLFHEAGIVADDQGSFILSLLRSGQWAALQRWMAPDNARFSMPLGWLGERDPTVSSVDPAGSSGSSAIPAQPHPNLAAGARCDVWAAACRRAQSSNKYASIQPLVRHAIDWHYATVTPALRSALSAHLLPELHAEVLSFLMPPSTLRDPAPSATETDPSLRLLESAVAALQPSHYELAAGLRQLHSQLRESAVERGFLERAFESERQMMRLPATRDSF